MKYVLGIDFGGGSSKATLLSRSGTVAATAVSEYPTSYPKSGMAEQNPEDWYNAASLNIKSVLKKTAVNPKDIECIALDAATHTAVLTDEDFNVLCPSIYWTDTRSQRECDFLNKNYGDFIYNEVYHKPDTIWTLPQLMWIRDNMGGVWKKAKRIMFAKDYVRHCLTGDYVTDFIEAEGSMLFSFNTLSWSAELCSVLGMDAAMLPEVVNPIDRVGSVTPAAAAQTGLIEGTPVICGTTDTVMEVFANGAVNKGQMTLKLATAGRICVVTDKPYRSRDLINYSHITDSLWYPGTATKSAASSLRWYRDTFGSGYAETDKAAENIPIGCDGLMFHPYLNGELTPYADPNLKASFTGISGVHTKAHFGRAVLEGVAYSLLDCMKALEAAGVKCGRSAIAIGGGSKSDLWLKIVSDCLGIKLVRMLHSDSSFGSAMLAGTAAGFFADVREAVKICNREISSVCPDMNNREIYLKCHEKYKAVHDALAPIYKGMY